MVDISVPSIIVITGIMASGKSTVAQALAERLSASVHLRGDIFRKMIVNGRAEMTPPLSDEATFQLRLRYRLAAQAAHSYCQAGFTVVYQDIIIGPMLDEVLSWLANVHPVYLVVLCPSPEVVAAREAGRGKTGYRDGWTPAQLDQMLRETTPRLGLWLDTSILSVEETVAAILAHLGEASVTT
ncbi:MAG TPA: ATP-binding protein [Ktedonobacterales bacterium]|jgi:predicted kinase